MSARSAFDVDMHRVCEAISGVMADKDLEDLILPVDAAAQDLLHGFTGTSESCSATSILAEMARRSP